MTIPSIVESGIPLITCSFIVGEMRIVISPSRETQLLGHSCLLILGDFFRYQ